MNYFLLNIEFTFLRHEGLGYSSLVEHFLGIYKTLGSSEFHKRGHEDHVWWHIPLIPVFGGQRQPCLCEFEAILVDNKFQDSWVCIEIHCLSKQSLSD